MAVNVSPTIPTESSPGVPAGGFSTWFKNIGDWLKSLSPAGATQYDTDWAAMPPETGFTGSAWYRRVGKTIYVDFTNTVRASGTGNATAFILPPDFRPIRQYNGVYAQINTGNATPGHTLWISNSGQLRGAFIAGNNYSGYAVFVAG